MNCNFITKKSCYKFKIILLWGIFLLAAGCRIPADSYAPQVLTAPTITTRRIGTSVQGRPIECIQFGHSGRSVLILSSIHGNEPASTVLAEALNEYLPGNRYLFANRRIIVIPAANPDGLAAGTRENINGVDLNRNFPADNRKNNRRFGLQPLTEPESRALYEFIETEKPIRILSIHQPYGCIDYDGPAGPLALRMARWCHLPVRRIGALPGSLGSWAGETKGIPVITFEMTAEDSLLDKTQLWSRYGSALIDFISYP